MVAILFRIAAPVDNFKKWILRVASIGAWQTSFFCFMYLRENQRFQNVENSSAKYRQHIKRRSREKVKTSIRVCLRNVDNAFLRRLLHNIITMCHSTERNNYFIQSETVLIRLHTARRQTVVLRPVRAGRTRLKQHVHRHRGKQTAST